MSWNCTLIEWEPGVTDIDALPIGAMWYYNPAWPKTNMDGSCYFRRELRFLSTNYMETERLPIIVLLPGRVPFCVDAQQMRNGEGIGGGWSVSGDAPSITVSPSINVGGVYHGFIQNGVITDDCEGRQFRLDGYQAR